MKYDNLTREIFGNKGVAALLAVLLGADVAEVQALPTRLAKTQLEVDALCRVRMPDGRWRLVHIETQSANDPDMPMRMLGYYVQIERTAGKKYDLATAEPLQYVLYVGPGPVKMATRPRYKLLRSYSYTLVNLADIPALRFLQQPDPDIRLLALLGKHDNLVALLEYLLLDIQQSADEQVKQKERIQRLIIISRLRNLQDKCTQLVNTMDLSIRTLIKDIPLIQEAVAEAVAEGEAKGRLESAVLLLDHDIIPREKVRALFELTDAELDAAIEKYSIRKK